MARGSKSKYTGKQKRKAEHIEEGYEKRGTSKKEAERQKERKWSRREREQGELSQRREKGWPEKETLSGL